MSDQDAESMIQNDGHRIYDDFILCLTSGILYPASWIVHLDSHFVCQSANKPNSP